MSVTVINARWVVPVNGRDAWLDHHALVMADGRILDLLPIAAAEQKYPDAEHIQRRQHALLPGLVNAHTHAAMNTMRGLANDLPLMTWLHDHVWPVEGHFMSPEFVADGTDLAMMEMIRCGTTCFNDMYFFPDVTARRVDAVGMRAAIGMILFDFPTAWAGSADEYLDKGLTLHAQYQDHERITILFAPHAPYTISDAPLQRMQKLADRHDLRVHMHVHETAFEVEQAQEQHGRRPLQRLDELGLLGPNMLAVHMTQLTDAEIARCAQSGVHVLHSPESNLKLASGICPVQKLRSAGVNVALGTDSSVSNNDLDMIGEMRTAALIGKIAAADAAAVSAHDVLTMATIAGARALGLDEQIGSLEIGKAADLCCVDLSAPETQPVFDPVSTLVYSADRQQVCDTWVAGKPLMLARRLTCLDTAWLQQRYQSWGEQLATYEARG